MLFPDLEASIGNTPLVELPKLNPKPGVRLFAKLEGNNPPGSVKDRIARSMLQAAERDGLMNKDKILLEPTSGNTGIGLAMLCQRRGYRMLAVMPESVSVERRQLLELFGAEIELTDGALGSNGSIARAQELAADPKYYMPYQYGNPANVQAHYDTTGPEIIADLPDVDNFVAGLGTGGTLMGVGKRLKEHNPAIKIVAAEPHPEDQVQGLRSLEHGFIPPILDLDQLDRKVVVRAEDALRMTRDLARLEGIFCGISCGAAVQVAQRVGRELDRANIVVLLADGGWKYLSTGLWTKPFEQALADISGKVMW
jgi:cysteine synthase B